MVLRRHGELLQIIANGCFLMDTSDGRSERLLIDAARDALDSRPAPHVLIGGLGVGFSLAHAAADPHWGRITVVEREPAIVEWHRSGPLSALSAPALADPRTAIVETDLVAFVNETCATFDALCLDIDNGPGWTVTEGNDSLYSPAGLASCARVLRPGGCSPCGPRSPLRNLSEPYGMPGSNRCVPKRSPLPEEFPTSCTSPSDLDSKGAVTPRTLLP